MTSGSVDPAITTDHFVDADEADRILADLDEEAGALEAELADARSALSELARYGGVDELDIVSARAFTREMIDVFVATSRRDTAQAIELVTLQVLADRGGHDLAGAAMGPSTRGLESVSGGHGLAAEAGDPDAADDLATADAPTDPRPDSDVQGARDAAAIPPPDQDELTGKIEPPFDPIGAPEPAGSDLTADTEAYEAFWRKADEDERSGVRRWRRVLLPGLLALVAVLVLAVVPLILG